ncbi:MAG: hypothetical protein IPK74_39295 [Deltaproteobacteria bacterium]|nr:hypothetical protein [Deltaproteobacteria bacterium]
MADPVANSDAPSPSKSCTVPGLSHTVSGDGGSPVGRWSCHTMVPSASSMVMPDGFIRMISAGVGIERCDVRKARQQAGAVEDAAIHRVRVAAVDHLERAVAVEVGGGRQRAHAAGQWRLGVGPQLAAEVVVDRVAGEDLDVAVGIEVCEGDTGERDVAGGVGARPCDGAVVLEGHQVAEPAAQDRLTIDGDDLGDAIVVDVADRRGDGEIDAGGGIEKCSMPVSPASTKMRPVLRPTSKATTTTSGMSQRSISSSALSSVRLTTSGEVTTCVRPSAPSHSHCTSGSKLSAGACCWQGMTSPIGSTALQSNGTTAGAAVADADVVLHRRAAARVGL